MAKLTLMFGLLLVLLGIWGYMESGVHSQSALLPAYFGIALGVLGSMARTNNAKTRMMVMHIAVTVGLVGFLASMSGIWAWVNMEKGLYTPQPLLVEEKAATALLLLFFVLLCVRSFISARRARQATPASKLAGGPRQAS